MPNLGVMGQCITVTGRCRQAFIEFGCGACVCRYAASNTRRGVESCGILAGLLDEKAGCFQISTLIIPKQEGTSDTVQARACNHARLHACMSSMSPKYTTALW